MQLIGLYVLNSEKSYKWDDITVPFTQRGLWNNNTLDTFWSFHELYLMEEEEEQILESQQEEELHAIKQMVASKYKAIVTDDVVNKQDHLIQEEKELLRRILRARIKGFQGIRSCWRGKKVKLDLVPNAKPFFRKSYNIPRAYHKLFKEELFRLCKEGVMTKITNKSEWTAPSFAIPKKSDEIRVVTDFRGLNMGTWFCLLMVLYQSDVPSLS